ncbi:acyloxyacyl hydrolase [Shewanella algae]|uniref:acyloxyacyl hydrolase n=2 Tax=Shewanella TaxID=22 RepID=UPI0031F4C88B
MPSYANAAEQSVAINYIHGEGQAKGSKLAYQLYLDTLKPISGNFELPLKASINFWECGENNQHDVNHLLAMSPILKYPLMRGQWLDFYLEAGIGFALLDDSQFAGKDVGSHYQFEDRLGFAFKFGRERKQTGSITYLHYSNAGLSKPNPGLDFVNLAYSYRF